MGSVFAATVARTNSVLMLHPSTPLGVGEIQRLAGEPNYAVTRSALEGLVKKGIARQTMSVGRSVYVPDADAPVHQVARLAAIIDLPWMESLVAAGVSPGKVRAIFVHGSIVRGGAGPKSDMDVLIIGSADANQVVLGLRVIESIIGRLLDPAVMRAEQLRDRIDAGEAFLQRIVDLAGSVRVWGEPM